jgi:IclR family pca regulon transcriptional regulator
LSTLRDPFTATPSDEPANRTTGRASDPNFLETLARGLEVLSEMAGSGGTIASLSRATGLPRPTVRRVLYTLVQLGYAREESKNFELTSQVTRFASAYLGTAGRTKVLQSRCESLAQELGEIVTVSVLDGDDQLHVAFAVPPNFVGVALGVGSRIPSYMTAAGRLLWSFKPDVEVHAFLNRLEPQARTSHTITDKAAIRAAIELARSNGCAVADAEYSSEFKGVACAIRGIDGRVFGALTINARKTGALTNAVFGKYMDRCALEASRLSREIVA